MNEKSALSPDEERELATDVARRALALTAPEELLVFDEAAAEYFVNPQRALRGDTRDEAVGFGLDMAMVTPAMLAVAVAAIRTVVTVVGTAVTEEGTSLTRRAMRRLFRLEPDEATTAATGTPVRLSADELGAVRRSALDRAIALGLAPQQAGLLADAITGELATGR